MGQGLQIGATVAGAGDDELRPAQGLGGQGRVKLGDGSWAVTGPDMAAGSRVRVTEVRGTELGVEPAP